MNWLNPVSDSRSGGRTIYAYVKGNASRGGIVEAAPEGELLLSKAYRVYPYLPCFFLIFLYPLIRRNPRYDRAQAVIFVYQGNTGDFRI